MKTLLKPTLAGVILLLASVHILPATDFRRWAPSDGWPVRSGYHIEWFRGVEGRDEGDLTGEIGIVWSDCRWTDTQYGDRGVFIQVIGIDGEPKFAGDGIRVADGYNRQEDPVVWPSRSDGCWFVAWEDFNEDQQGNLYCTKLDANGQRLWAADIPVGVPVCVYPSAQEDMRITEDLDGGCIIAWRDMRGGDTGDIYATHILSNGVPDTSDGRWPANGKVVVARPGGQTNHTADADGQGGMLIGWKDARLQGNTDIWAQRINPDGEMMWGDGEGVRACGNLANQDAPKLCPDGANGCFVSWVDERNNQVTGKDIYVQRLNQNGEPMWTPDGEAVCDAEREQGDNRIVNSYNGEAIVVWEDKRDDGLTTDLYAMRISGAGGMVKQWNPSTGVPVAVADNNQAEVRLYPDFQGGAYFAWEDERNGGVPDVEIWAQRFNRQGSPVWQENGIPVCQDGGYNNSVVVRFTAKDNGCVVIWGVGPNGTLGIYAQRFDSEGNAAWQVNGIPICVGIAGNARNPMVFPRPDEGTFVAVWLDGRADSGSVPYVQYLRNNYNLVDRLLPEGGVPVLAGTIGGGVSHDAATDGGQGAIVVWEDHRRGSVYAIFAQRMSGAGGRMWGESGAKIADGGDYEQSTPAVCADGSGGAFIAWKSDTDERHTNLFMQRVNSDGNGLWANSGIRMTNHHADDEIFDIISDDLGGAVLLFGCSGVGTNDDLWAIRVNGDGTQLWGDGNGIAVCAVEGKQRDPNIVKHPLGFAMVWVDERGSEPGSAVEDIYTQILSLDGQPLLGAGGAAVIADEDRQDYPELAVDSHSNVWVVWEDSRYRATRGGDIFVQRFRPELDRNGDLDILFGVYGKEVCTDSSDQKKPQITNGGAAGAWIVWEDQRSGSWEDIYGTHLDSTGSPFPGWVNLSGNPVVAAFHRQIGARMVQFAPSGWGGVGVVWVDMRATGKEELFNLYTQRLDDYKYETAGETEIPAPLGYYLGDAYPNPFNSTTLIAFTVPKEGDVTLRLFDSNGRLVRDLASSWWSAGTHSALIDGSGLAGGTYFIQMEAGKTKLERKIQLVK